MRVILSRKNVHQHVICIVQCLSFYYSFLKTIYTYQAPIVFGAGGFRQQWTKRTKISALMEHTVYSPIRAINKDTIENVRRWYFYREKQSRLGDSECGNDPGQYENFKLVGQERSLRKSCLNKGLKLVREEWSRKRHYRAPRLGGKGMPGDS